MAVVPQDVYVTANFKETELTAMRVGQPVTIHVDAYPDQKFDGKVQSIQQGTGAHFSLLPPENATGNYVKVVQRVPVKITFDDTTSDAYKRLSPGMSVEPSVKIQVKLAGRKRRTRKVKMKTGTRMTRTIAPALLAALLAGGAGGCMVGPNYKPPALDAPDGWAEPFATPTATTRPFTPPSRTIANAQPVVRWWMTFKDDELDSLVARAISQNLNLKQATSRIREARAQRRVTAADLYPEVDAIGQYSHTRVSQNGVTSQIGGGQGSATGGAGGGTGGMAPPAAGANGGTAVPGAVLSEFDLFQLGLNSASWEIDVFGRVRRAIQSADASIQSSVEDRRGVLLTLLGDVATNYIQLRGAQRRLALALDNLDVQQQTLDLQRQRQRAGTVTDLDVARAEAQVQTTAATVPPLQVTISQSIHQLGTLLGEQPETLYAELTEAQPIPPVPDEVPIGLPSGLLRRRPDIRMAERQLAAATANVGVAVANLFPQFSLTGSLGLQSVNTNNLLNYGSRYYSVGPSVSWPIFDAGKLRAQVQVQNALQEQQLLGYQQTVLTALRDVEDALVAYAKQQARRESLQSAVSANQRAVALSQEQYKAGTVDFTTVLDAQLNLFTSQDALASSETMVSTNLVTLYRALGGGWEIELDPYAPADTVAAARN